jgi:F-type H+-transporting ATPase subunit b|nr:MAG: ATP synthase F0 subunit B [Actinomycetota bacterium]
MLNLFVLAAEEGHAEGPAALLLPAKEELIAGIVAFAIVFLFVWKFVWPSLNKTLEARQAAITGQMQQAEAAKVEAEKLLADYQAQLAEAKAEANRILDEARSQAEQMKADILAKAQAEAEEIRAKAREEAQNELSRALADARGQVGQISVELAEKIVGKTLDASAHQELIDQFLADLERL